MLIELVLPLLDDWTDVVIHDEPVTVGEVEWLIVNLEVIVSLEFMVWLL